MPQDKVTVLYSESDSSLRDRTRRTLPSAKELPTVDALIADDCKDLLRLIETTLTHNADSCLLLTAGFPCQDLSGAKKGTRLGLLGRRSCLAAALPVITTKLREKFPHLQIFFLFENVASMEPKWSRLLDTAFGTPSFQVDLADSSPTKRRRLIWTNIPKSSRLPLEQIHVPSMESVLDSGWTSAYGIGLLPPAKNRKWECFLRPLPPGEPPEMPVDFVCLSPFSYCTANLVFKIDMTDSEKNLVRQRLDEGDARCTHSFAIPKRRSLISWIHTQEGSLLVRPLRGAERLRALGFSENFIGPRPPPFSDKDWELSSFAGNCFPLPAIIQILRPVADSVTHKADISPGPLPRSTSTWSHFFTQLGLAVPDIPTPPDERQGRRR